MRPDFNDTTGFTKTLIASIILHIAVISAVIIFHRPDNRHFITPVYTMVSIVQSGHSDRSGQTAIEQTTANQQEPVKTVKSNTAPPHKKNAAKHTKTPKKSAAPANTIKIKTSKIVKKTDTSKAHDTASVDLALKNIEKKLQKKSDNDLVASRIEGMKKTREGGAAKETSSAVDEIKKRISAQSKGNPSGQATAAAKVVSGSTGASREALEAQYHAYYGLIRDRIQENWRYPYRDDKVMIIVYIKLARDGRVISSRIEESSGNGLFDESLLSAIKKASPFAPLPQGFQDEYLEAELRFCPGCAQ